MLIQLIQEQPEIRFLEALAHPDEATAVRVVLLCKFSQTRVRAKVEQLQSMLQTVLYDQAGELYFCEDGDVAICWRGTINEARLIVRLLRDQFPELMVYPIQTLFAFYDVGTQSKALRAVFRYKLGEETDALLGAPIYHHLAWDAEFTIVQQVQLQDAISQRANRNSPVILIVEDQDFSRRLLSSMYEMRYRCYSARNAEQAAQLYAEHAPDIAMLDIELPDVDGHTLAALFKRHDPASHLVMVTANNYARDVTQARANKVQGFVVKPYNYQKMTGIMDVYFASKKDSA